MDGSCTCLISFVDHLARHALIVAELEDLPHLGDKKKSQGFANTLIQISIC